MVAVSPLALLAGRTGMGSVPPRLVLQILAWRAKKTHARVTGQPYCSGVNPVPPAPCGPANVPAEAPSCPCFPGAVSEGKVTYRLARKSYVTHRSPHSSAIRAPRLTEMVIICCLGSGFLWKRNPLKVTRVLSVCLPWPPWARTPRSTDFKHCSQASRAPRKPPAKQPPRAGGRRGAVCSQEV